MPEIKNNFIQGKMNKDLDDRLLPNGQYRDAVNIKVAKSDASDVGSVQNIKGNDYEYGAANKLSFTGWASGSDTTYDAVSGASQIKGSPAGHGVTATNGLALFGANTIEITKADGTTVATDGSTKVYLGSLGSDTVGGGSGQPVHLYNTVTSAGVAINVTIADDTAFKLVYPTYSVDTIGCYVDKLSGDVFWFTTDFDGISDDDPTKITSRFATSSNHCRIYHKEIAKPNQAPKAIIDSFRLNFSKKHPILHINKVDNLLFWTDNYNQPRKINITTAIADREKSDADKYYNNDNYLEDKISVAQYAPPSAPKVRMSYDSSIKSKHIQDRFVKFAYRFQYDNNEYSVISPFTQTCFHPGKGKNFNYGVMGGGAGAEAGILTAAEQTDAIEQTTIEMFQNLANVVDLFIDLPSNNDKDSHAACSINQALGESGGYPITIDGVSGTIANTNLLATERGDGHYTVATSAGTLDSTNLPLSASIDSKIPLINNQKLYFFTAPTAYANNLKIKKVQILYSEAGSMALKVVDTIDFRTQILSDDGSTINNIIYRAEPVGGNAAKLLYGYRYTYNSTKPIQTLPDSELLRIGDVIPVKAKTQEVSGNRVIYGNFYQHRNTDGFDASLCTISSGDQDNYNPQYVLSSVKSNRDYAVGLVLADRYGRQTTVLAPIDNTEFLDPKSGSVASWNHYALKFNFDGVIGDAYAADTNPLGWYSYKVVVKQTELEYYNVFAPTLLDNIPSDEKRTWLVLSGDNINKVPRDVTDINTADGTQGSQTSLLPKVLDTTGTQAQQSGTDYVDIISIGTKSEHGIGSSINDFYLNNKNPLLAELPDGSGRNHVTGTEFSNLVVLETKPIKSALDIYYETSTAGLVSHLNTAIYASLGNVPNGITLSNSTVAESDSSGTKVADLTTTGSGGGSISSPTYQILSIVDGNGTNRSGAFVIDGEDIDTGETFEFKNNNEDTYTVKIKSTKGSNSVTVDKTITIANIAPTQTVGSSLTVAASTNTGTTVRTITAVNGSAKSGATTNNLTFSIQSGNTDSDFSINSSTGVITVANSLTSGDTYTLGIRTTDVGGGTDNDNLSVTISSASYTSFYLTTGQSDANGACNAHVGTLRYHNGSSSTPSQNDVVYTDAQGSTVLDGSQGPYWGWAPGGGSHNGSGQSFQAQIASNGVVGAVTLC